MNVNDASDRFLGRYLRWLARRPLIYAGQPIAIGLVVLVVGRFALHSRLLVTFTLILLAVSALLALPTLAVQLRKRRGKSSRGS